MTTSHSTTRRLPIQGFPGYEIGEDGSVWCSRPINRHRKPPKTPRPVKPLLPKTGYKLVDLSISGKVTRKRIHRLVLEAFVGPCPEGMECRHLNNNRGDNRLTNLEWATHKENESDKEKYNTRPKGEKHWATKLTPIKVKQIRKLLDASTPIRKVASIYKMSYHAIRCIGIRKTWKWLK